MWPWTDRVGRISPLKSAVFIMTLVPALWLVVEAMQGWLGERPVMEAIHQTGLWSVRLLAMTLAITPLQQAMRWPRLVGVRRLLGVSVLAYAALHFMLYVVNQNFDLPHVGLEILFRLYLLIGFVAFCGLSVLGVTSADGMIARLGSERWARLHKIVYGIMVLASLHFFMQSKLDVTEPTLMAGIFFLLMAHRIVRFRKRALTIVQTALLGASAAFITVFSEALYFVLAYHAPLAQVLAANLDFSFKVRPGWYVLFAGFLLLCARLARPFFQRNPAASSFSKAPESSLPVSAES
ncbi:MAG TPA: protein-methionine-sulfoxide reductase heme-binding subunit MsrQ [Methylocella sp.]|nr:protein-methionine-sulfoxide reductase heme-binding subunit MsrQ [Methylocella sp.]